MYSFKNDCYTKIMFRVILIGIKHCGKSTVGKALAEKKEVGFFDIDTIIEKKNKKTCREIYLENGKDGFKKAEFEACEWIVQKVKNSAVIATGGGICENQEAMQLLQSFGIIVMLDVPEKNAIDRILDEYSKTNSLPAYISNKNPKNENEIREIFHGVYINRVSILHKQAKLVIQTAHLNGEVFSVDEICNTILSLL